MPNKLNKLKLKNMNTLTKNSTNKQIQDAMPQLSDGKTRIFSIENSKTGASKVAFLCQETESNSSVDAGAQLFLGWGKRIVRHQQRIAAELVDNFKVGQIVPLDIATKETNLPSYEGQTPLVNTTTSEVIKDSEGNDIYTTTSLVAVGTGSYTSLSRKQSVVAIGAGA
jgi:hypothetical protein